MKNIFLKFSFLMIIAFTVSCSRDTEKFYEGDPYIHFITESDQAYVFTDQQYNDYDLEFGTVQNVEGDPNATLVFVSNNSTAVPGVDFEILNGGKGSIQNGTAKGTFKVRIFKNPAVQTGKIANFKLQSSNMANNLDYQSFELKMSLTCPMSTFLGAGNFSYEGWLFDADNYVIQEGANNTLIVKNFFVNSASPADRDMILSYNPKTFAVTMPMRNTGNFVAQYNGYIWGQTSTAQKSSFDPCTRELILYIAYSIPGVGSYGDQEEYFAGF